MTLFERSEVKVSKEVHKPSKLLWGWFVAGTGLCASCIAIFAFITGRQSIIDVINTPFVNPNPLSTPIHFPTSSAPNPQVQNNVGEWPGRILFIYDNEVTQLTADGQISQLFVAPKQATHLKWSPDGRHIAYIGVDVDGTPSFFVMDSDGTNGRKFVLPPHNYGALDDIAWFADSKQILVSAQYYGLGIVDIESQNVSTLGICEDPNSWINDWPRAITLNDQNNMIAFYEFMSHQIMVRPIKNSQCSIWLSQSDMETSDITPLSFSKDGNQIIFGSSHNLYWVNAPDTAAARIISIGQIGYNYQDLPRSLAWSPDKRYLAMLSMHDLYIFDGTTGSYKSFFTDDKGKLTDFYSVGWLP
jgi:WD40 repeat protein